MTEGTDGEVHSVTPLLVRVLVEVPLNASRLLRCHWYGAYQLIRPNLEHSMDTYILL